MPLPYLLGLPHATTVRRAARAVAPPTAPSFRAAQTAPTFRRSLWSSAMPALLTMLQLVGDAATASADTQAAGPNQLSQKEIREGWIQLFDGETLFGWKPAGKADWRVVDGTISVGRGEPGLLVTLTRWADYVLRVDFQADVGTNSGIFLRTPPGPGPGPGPGDVGTKCYEMNIDDSAAAPFPTGSFVGRKRCETPPPPSSQWRTCEVLAQRGRFTVRIDGRHSLDYVDSRPVACGHVGLQLNRGRIAFRNVKLKPLSCQSLFSGKDLTGWRIHPDSKCEWSVMPDGRLHVRNGRGQLETEGRWADFVLQVDAFVNGKSLNSGVFFRSIPGEFWNGYESQIQNAFRGGDRTKPVDCGTGGIYRRSIARKVVADDFQWLTKTIVADGPHIAVWVNGYQVTDWIDTRKPHANPRNGLRLAAGSIVLQSHDPTTDFYFRNLRIAQLPTSR